MHTRLTGSLAGGVKLTRMLAVMTGLFIAAILGILFYTTSTMHEHKQQALVIDLAGRQRMLNQRHMKEILLIAQGSRADYHKTRTLFTDTLKALTEGGPAVLALETDQTVYLPPAPTVAIRGKFNEQKQLMAEFTAKADAFLLLNQNDPAYSAKLLELLDLNLRLHSVANEAVELLDRYSDSKIASMIEWEAAVGALVALLGALMTWHVVRDHRELQTQIAERRRAEANLRESEDKRIAALKQSDALKSALLSSVSHELRTPLTTIKTSVSSLFDNAERMPSAMRAEFLGEIHKEIDYLDRLVSNLLDMSRIEAGSLVPQREWHPFEDLLEGAIRRLGRPLQERPLDIVLAEDLPSVHVDGVEIQQVLMNLLDNAIKYSPGGSSIRLEVRQSQREIEVRITNSGEGIPQEDLVRVFDRFHRVRSPHKRAIPGTGLGLAICKGLIEAHGGRIWAESVPGETTTITFTLPTIEPMPSFSFERQHPARRAS